MLEIPQFTTKTVKLLMEHSMDEEHLLDWIAFVLTDWGWVTHICISKLNIIGSDNGSAPGRRQAIIWTNAGILLNGPMGTNFSENLIEIYTFSFRKKQLKISFGKWQPFILGLNVLTTKKSFWTY